MSSTAASPPPAEEDAAFHEKLAQVEASLQAMTPAATPPLRTDEIRISPRKKLTGKVRIAIDNKLIASGKLLDISTTGVSILSDDQIPARKVFMLEIDSFSGGRRHLMVVRAIVVYSILVGGRGQKFGIQFGQLEPKATQTLGDLLEMLP